MKKFSSVTTIGDLVKNSKIEGAKTCMFSTMSASLEIWNMKQDFVKSLLIGYKYNSYRLNNRQVRDHYIQMPYIYFTYQQV